MTEDKKRLKASREIGQALRAVQAIQMLYRITGGLALAVAALALYADTLTIGAVAAGAGVVLFIGAVQVREQPGPWSVGMAVVITLLVAYMISVSRHATVSTIWGTASAIALWCVLPLAFRAQKLLERYPDLYIAEKWKGRREAPTETRRARDIHAETRRQKKASLIKMGIFVGSFVGFIVLVNLFALDEEGGGGDSDVGISDDVPVFGSRAVDFQEAWNEGTWEQVEEFLPPAQRKRRAPKVRRLMKKRGWEQQRPKLLNPRIDSGSYIKATYPIEGFSSDIVFVIYWDAGETQWWWARTKWPKTELVKR